MRMMPCAAPYQCALHMRVGHVHGAEISEISQSSRITTVESSTKSEHNLYLACEDSLQNVLSSFALSLVLLASTVH